MRGRRGKPDHVEEGAAANTKHVGVPIDAIALDGRNPIHDFGLADLATLPASHDHNFGQGHVLECSEIGFDLGGQDRKEPHNLALHKDNHFAFTLRFEKITHHGSPLRKRILRNADAVAEGHRDVEVVIGHGLHLVSQTTNLGHRFLVPSLLNLKSPLWRAHLLLERGMGSVNTIAEGQFLGLYARDGWEFAERPNTEGVVGILALTPQEEVILVEQFRIPVQSLVIEIPAGLIGDEEAHRGEAIEETARRELLEETGYRAGSVKRLLSSPTSPGMTTELTHLFHATELERVHAGGGVDGEEIVVHRVPRSELREWLAGREEEGLLIDFKIHAALWLAGFHDLQ